ncbi:hypothetical protein R5R35_010964 [Gryllus longicercus]|uniref:Uncharacterized protein n=1 Tax=Gryllus longicercus TaxID=2509291 RepID=A0AAN9VLA1_9ORTH
MRLLGRRLASCWGAGVARAAAKKLPSRRQLLRSAAWLLLVLLVLSAPSLLYHQYVQSVEMYFYQLQMEHMKALTAASPPSAAVNGCTIPLYDPFDARVRRFMTLWPPVECGQPQPYLTYVDGDGYIRVNHSGVRHAGLAEAGVQCAYAEIRRDAFTDDTVSYGARRAFADREKLSAPFVKAECTRRDSGKLVYEAVHAWVEPLSDALRARVLPADPLRPSVLIFGVDSMSRLNFVRQLPRTHALLTETFGAHVFTGMVKVGDNTYPNMLTMLTGMAARKKPDIKVTDWGDNKANGFFDDLPVVWKNFSENGYVTMTAEDQPELTAFNYLAKGFMEKPTDYYMRPFWLAIDSVRNFRSSDARCYGNTPHFEFLFNYTREFVEKMRDKRYFAFSFLTGFSHNSINEVQVIDAPFHALLEGLWRGGALRNTLVMILGDHGNRFDAIRATVLGRVEERMPYLAVALPPALRAAKPFLEEGLRNNNASFISWYDVYELLADVALGNLEAASRVPRFGQLGCSLFRAVPARSCPQAGVASEYCVCVREVALRAGDEAVQAAAQALVAHVNALLRRAPCAPLALARVHSAQLLLPNGGVSTPKGFAVEVRVAVRVAPSDALLEGTVERDAWEPLGRVRGEVARINKYGNQSHCIGDRTLRLYCYCVDLLPRSPPPPPAA